MYPLLTVLIELGVLFGGAVYLVRGTTSAYRKKWIWITSIIFSAIFLIINFAAPATEPTPMSVLLFGIILYGLFSFIGYWAERKK